MSKGRRLIVMVIAATSLSLMSLWAVVFLPINLKEEVQIPFSARHQELLEKSAKTETEIYELLQFGEEYQRQLDSREFNRKAEWERVRLAVTPYTWVPWLLFFLVMRPRSKAELIVVLGIPSIFAAGGFLSLVEAGLALLSLVVAEVVARVSLGKQKRGQI